MALAQAVYPTNTPPPTKEELIASANNRNQKPYGSVRNVKFTNNELPSNQPTHEQFNANYANRGIKIDTTQQAANDSVRNISVTGRKYDNGSNVIPFQRRDKSILNGKSSSKTSIIGSVSKSDKEKVKGVNFFIRSTGLFMWSTVQIPLALLNIAMLAFVGVSETIKGYLDYIPSTSLDDEYAKFRDWLLEKTVGITLSDLDPLNFLLLTILMLFAFGVTTLIGMYVIYKVSGLSPLGGEGGGSKMVAFVIVLLGYCVPFLNLFPLFYLWTIAIGRHPK